MFLKGISLLLVLTSPAWSEYRSDDNGSDLRLQLPNELKLYNIINKLTKGPETLAPPVKDEEKKGPLYNYPPYYPPPWYNNPYYPPYGPVPPPKPTPRPPTYCERFPTSSFCTSTKPTPPTPGWPPYCNLNPTSQFCQALLPPQGWCLLVPTYPNCDKWPAITSTTKLCDVASFLAECQTTPPSDVTLCVAVPMLPACTPGVPTEPLYCLLAPTLTECRLCSWNPTATACEVCATTTPDPSICP